MAVAERELFAGREAGDVVAESSANGFAQAVPKFAQNSIRERPERLVMEIDRLMSIERLRHARWVRLACR
jgi:hypothetical protein